MRSFRRNKKGFTLIEVLVVITIIAILGSIVAVSTVAILRNAEKKTVTARLNNYWSISAKAFHQVNHGFSTGSGTTALKDLLKTRLGSGITIVLGTDKCTSLSKNTVYLQYEYNQQSLNNKYKLVCIWTRYEDNYYYTTDGESIVGPKTSL